MTYSIYTILVNEKYYVGLFTTSLEQRTKEHKKCVKQGDTRILYNALRKYNMVDSFELIVIDTADTLEELCEKEKEYIIKYNSYYKNGKGYNMTYGGEGNSGYVYTEVDKEKMSKGSIKYFQDNPDARQHLSTKLKQFHKDNPDARQHLSAKIKQFHKDNPNAGKQHSEKMKIFFGENLYLVKEHSEKLKKYYQDNPDIRQQVSEKMEDYWDNNQNARKHMSEKQKENWKNSDLKKKKLDTMGQNKQFEIYKDGIFINTFNYQFEAKEFLKKEYQITRTIKIGEVLAKKRKSSAGFVFKYNEN